MSPPQYESKKRVSAEEAMKHSYFRQLGMRVHTLPESEYSDTCRSLLLRAIVLWRLFFLPSQPCQYSRWKKCSCRETPATGAPRTQSPVSSSLSWCWVSEKWVEGWMMSCWVRKYQDGRCKYTVWLPSCWDTDRKQKKSFLFFFYSFLPSFSGCDDWEFLIHTVGLRLTLWLVDIA